jgi:TP901-1 family phage major tail protein|tara:strand:- start:230 stop:685 length:456 start_codon:yes stop_codon:yes gene_type:complete
MAVKTISGSDLLVAIDQSDSPVNHNSVVLVGGSTSCVVNITQEAIDTTNKDSGGRKEFINGVSSWTIDVDSFYTDGTSDGETVRFGTLYDALDGGYKIAVKFYTGTANQTGVQKYQGWGYITDISTTGSVGEWATYSVSIQGTGTFTKTSV